MQTSRVRNFESNLFGTLTTFIKESDNSIWFVGRQVAEKLGYNVSNTSVTTQILRNYCPDKRSFKTLSDSLSVSGIRSNAAMISESDLYRLVIGSAMQEAEYFRDWVCREVLPSIREHGGYSAEQPSMGDQRADDQLFQQVNERINNLTVSFANMSEAQALLTASVASLAQTVAEMAVRETPPTQRIKPEGYVTASEIKARYASRLSKGTVQAILDTVGWPKVEYDAVKPHGLVPSFAYPVRTVIFEQSMDLGQLMRKVVEEADQTSPTSSLHTHRYAGSHQFYLR